MSEAVPVPVPQENPNDERAVLVAWEVPSGTHVEAGRRIATLETTKSAFDVDAPVAGYLIYEAEPKTMLVVGAPFAWIATDPQFKPAGRVSPDAPARPTVGSSPTGAPVAPGRFTRKALKRMRELSLREADFPGDARVDVAEVEKRAAGAPAAGGPRRDNPSAPGASGAYGKERSAGQPGASFNDAVSLEQPPSKMIEAATLAESYRQVVPSLVALPFDAERIAEHLRRIAAAEGPLSLLELVLHATAAVMPEFPDLNGFFADGSAYTYREINLGFAINAGRSLKVPVVRRAASLSRLEIARAVRELTLRYMRNELTTADMMGGTFTVTDLSSQGAVHFVPVLNQRQAAILGLCARHPASRYCELVLTFDHRMSDGMRAAQFLSRLREHVEG
jgi:pyruvate/2-oxoglutarate dehydrogenase complex dihydrolipoamide acyltransferase (E2) component